LVTSDQFDIHSGCPLVGFTGRGAGEILGENYVQPYILIAIANGGDLCGDEITWNMRE